MIGRVGRRVEGGRCKVRPVTTAKKYHCNSRRSLFMFIFVARLATIRVSRGGKQSSKGAGGKQEQALQILNIKSKP